MSDLKKYEGVIPAFYACYDDQGEVSPERTHVRFEKIRRCHSSLLRML
ncbi:N-acetylneuraminate lyase subunit, truncation [Streptococcus pneumoniae]|nr:N-acetylneuraminate lyase subunit, truncation [Streptococcus pneumoniae]